MEMVEPDVAERLTVGVAMGLAVSGLGGSLLFIEATKVRGNGNMIVTGNLQNVMSESVRTAFSLLKSKVFNAIVAEGGYDQMMITDSTGGTQPSAGTGATATGVEQPFLKMSNASAVELTGPLEGLVAKQRELKNAKDMFNTVDVHVHF